MRLLKLLTMACCVGAALSLAIGSKRNSEPALVIDKKVIKFFKCLDFKRDD